MEKVKEKLAQFNEAIKNAEEFLDNIDETKNIDSIIKEILQHRKNIQRISRWNCWMYTRTKYFRPLNKSLIGEFLNKYPIIKLEYKHSTDSENNIEDFLHNHCLEEPWQCSDQRYWAYQLKNKNEKLFNEVRAEAKKIIEKREEMEPLYEEVLIKADKAFKFYQDSIGDRENEIRERITNALAYFKAKKEFERNKK